MKKTGGTHRNWLKGTRKNLPHKTTSNDIASVILMIVWVFVSVVASQFAIGFLMLSILGSNTFEQPVWTAVYSLLSYGVAMLLIIFVPPAAAKKFHFLKGRASEKVTTREELGLSGTPTWTDIGLSPVAFIASTLLAALFEYLFTVFPWFNISEVQDVGFNIYMAPGERVIAFLVLVVLAPIVEEIIFRGWLYGKMRERLSAPWAIVLVSLLFGLVHFQWNVGVNVFALSVVLCVLREITGTVYAGILTHMIKNGVAFYVLYVLGM